MEGDHYGVGCLLSLKPLWATSPTHRLRSPIQPPRSSYPASPPSSLSLSISIYYAFDSFICYDCYFYLIVFFNCYGTISLLLLQEGSKDSPNRKIRLLKASYIKEFILIGQGDDPLDLKHCHLDLNLLQSREDAALR